MTRQITRHEERTAAKAELSAMKQRIRKLAKRQLLEAQTLREKQGFYTGRSVAAAVAPSRSRVTKRKVKKGQMMGRILTTEIIGGREVSYHATKGWRSRAA